MALDEGWFVVVGHVVDCAFSSIIVFHVVTNLICSLVVVVRKYFGKGVCS